MDNLSAGEPLAPAAYASLFGTEVLLYDDRELTAALLDSRVPQPEPADALADAQAVCIAVGTAAPHPVAAGLAIPPPGAELRRNPLYVSGAIQWPSERYREEYAALATYPLHTDAPERAVAATDPAHDALARRRVLLDLPERW